MSRVERLRTRSEPIEALASSGRRSVRLRDGLRYGLLVFLAVRIGLSITALAATALLPHATSLTATPGSIIPSPTGVPGWPAQLFTPGWHNLVTAWERFDGLWYLRIAAHGYANGDGSAAFFPLYPILIRGVSFLVGDHPLAAALLVSNASFAAALVVMYALTAREISEETARRAVVYMAVFPTSFFFLAPYSESLFLLLVLLTFWFVRTDRWAQAALAAAAAALTRNLGVLLVVPLAVEAVQRTHSAGDGLARLARRLAWSSAPALALVPYLWFWKQISGDWLAPLHQQANWDRHLELPFLTIAKGTHEALRWIGVYPGGYHLLDWLIVTPVLAAGLYVVIRFRPTYGAYVWASLLAPLAFIFAGRPLMSLPRFAVPLFPVFWAFARWTRRSRGLQDVVIVTSSLLLGVMLLLFVNWYYIF